MRVTLPYALSTSAGTHNQIGTQEDDKEGIMRWLLQALLQKQQHMPYWWGQNVPEFSRPPTLTSGGSLLWGFTFLQGDL